MHRVLPSTHFQAEPASLLIHFAFSRLCQIHSHFVLVFLEAHPSRALIPAYFEEAAHLDESLPWLSQIAAYEDQMNSHFPD